ncbi:hypothetical protein BFP75_10365 [Maribacter sp. 4G9]|nr:hypothetical protein BFP75_10365 [Maribacter sp. 4G9]
MQVKKMKGEITNLIPTLPVPLSRNTPPYSGRGAFFGFQKVRMNYEMIFGEKPAYFGIRSKSGRTWFWQKGNRPNSIPM